jgi:hypothetical protein
VAENWKGVGFLLLLLLRWPDPPDRAPPAIHRGPWRLWAPVLSRSRRFTSTGRLHDEPQPYVTKCPAATRPRRTDTTGQTTPETTPGIPLLTKRQAIIRITFMRPEPATFRYSGPTVTAPQRKDPRRCQRYRRFRLSPVGWILRISNPPGADSRGHRTSLRPPAKAPTEYPSCRSPAWLPPRLS